MNGAQSPLLFIISEPVGSPLANDLAYRLAEQNVRTWIGSLAPAGELQDTALDTLRASAAVVLVFDDAAAHSRHVDRHLLVARQMGKPLIPVRFQAVDEGLLRQELLDAQWIDAAAPGAVAEIARRAFDDHRAQRDQAVGAGAQDVGGGPADTGARRQGTEVLGAGTVATAHAGLQGTAASAEEPAPRQPVPVGRRTSLLRSPTRMIALLALVAVVFAIWYTNRPPAEADRDRVIEAAPQAPVIEDYASSAEVEEQSSPAVETAPPLSAPDTPAPALEPPAAAAVSEEATRPARPDSAEEASGAAEPAGEAGANDTDGVATVRAFYSALSRGDGGSAAALVVPGKRQSGPLSGPALSRYYSSFRRPLRLRSVTPVGANTVRVAYDYVLGDGRLCEGRATVDVVRSGERGLVSSIRTQGPC